MSAIYKKYNVTKVDGSPVDPEAQYFVLRIDTDIHARAALLAYANSIEIYDWDFADALRDWVASMENNLEAE